VIFALDFIVLVLILRASVKVGYYPVFWGVIYGVLIGVLSLVPHGELVPALTEGAISGLLCALLLFALSLFDGRPIVWWLVLVSAFIIPFISGAFN
jgi:hypothetical protein